MSFFNKSKHGPSTWSRAIASRNFKSFCRMQFQHLSLRAQQNRLKREACHFKPFCSTNACQFVSATMSTSSLELTTKETTGSSSSVFDGTCCNPRQTTFENRKGIQGSHQLGPYLLCTHKSPTFKFLCRTLREFHPTLHHTNILSA